MKTAFQASEAHSNQSWIWLAGVTLLVSLRPVGTANLWWDLSRGREVLSGSIGPSSDLLSLDNHYEADWLSGLPFYMLWNLGGIHLLAAVPVIAALVLVFFLRSKLRQDLHLFSMLSLSPLLLWSVGDGLQPAPQLFDILGLLILFRIVNSTISLRRKNVCVFLTFLAWANFGPSPIWGIFLLTFFSNIVPSNYKKTEPRSKSTRPSSSPPLKFSHVFFWILLACLGGMLTPRGILTWRDSLILFSPQIFSHIELYQDQIWQGAWSQVPWSMSELALLILWCGWHGIKFRSLRLLTSTDQSQFTNPPINIWQSFLITIFPLLAAILSKKNIPLCGIWILFDIILTVQSAGWMNKSNSQSNFTIRKGRIVIASLLACAAIGDSIGYGLSPHQRLGWGISRELDLRLFDSRLVADTDKQITGWAPDGRSVGIVSWIDGNVLMTDHPQRALLGNRLLQSKLLLYDLTGAHRAQYRRDDGSWGGWVRQFSDWDVSLLIIPSDMKEVISELLRSPWQQVDLDSPSVPFVSSNEPYFLPYILEATQQQGFVEFGPWRPTIDIYAGMGWRYDVIEYVGLGIEPAPARLQSQIFRAMNLPMASLRSLLPVRTRNGLHSLKKEFLACQVELAYQEWFSFGEASLYRRKVISKLSDASDIKNHPWCKLDTQDNTSLDQSVHFYIQGDIPQAIQSLSGDSSSEHFSKAMLQLELGDIDRTLIELEKVLQSQENDSLFIAASYWTQQIKQFSGQ